MIHPETNIPNDADWVINAYKNKQILIETWHRGQASLSMEIEAFMDRIRRREIDYIDVIQRVPPFKRYQIP